MNALRYRPLAVLCTVFYVSACFLAGADKYALAIVGATALGAGAVSLIFNRKARVTSVVILALFAVCAASVFCLFSFALKNEKYLTLTGEKAVSGEVTKAELSGASYGIYIADAEIDGNTVTVCLKTSKYLCRGDKFSGTAYVSAMTEDMAYYKSQGAYLEVTDKALSVAEGEEGENIFYKLNSRLSAELCCKLGRERGGFAAAVLLGNRSYLSPELYANLKAMGITHLIALSGLHLSVICGIAAFIFRPLGKKAILTSSAVTALFYMLFTDFSPSIVRAAVMLVMLNLASFFKRGRDCATALGFCAALVTLISPAAVFDLGFQLSLSAVAGVNCAGRYISEKWHRERPICKKVIFSLISPLAIGVGAAVFTLPPLLLNNSSFTWVSAIMTVPTSALLALIIWMLPPLFILPFDFYADTVGFLIGIFEKLVSDLSDLGEFSLLCENKKLGAAMCALSALGFVLTLCAKRRKNKIAIFAVSAALILSFSGICVFEVRKAQSSVAESLEVSDDGDVLVFKNKSATLAIDVTGGSSGACEQISNIALAMGDTEVDAIIIADPHSSHYAALTDSSLAFTADVIYLPDGRESYYLAERLSRYVAVEFYRDGDVFDVGGITVEVLPTYTSERSTRPALAFAVTVNSETAVYAGSSYSELGGTAPACHRVYYGSYGPKSQS